jgi:NADH:ubiquinone oxidoreductase subunit 4 (subunit M)
VHLVGYLYEDYHDARSLEYSYGLLRVFPVLFKFGFRFDVVWVSLGLVGGLYVSLFYIRQTDLKSLIADSFVAHISMVIGGIITLSYCFCFNSGSWIMLFWYFLSF